MLIFLKITFRYKLKLHNKRKSFYHKDNVLSNSRANFASANFASANFANVANTYASTRGRICGTFRVDVVTLASQVWRVCQKRYSRSCETCQTCQHCHTILCGLTKLANIAIPFCADSPDSPTFAKPFCADSPNSRTASASTCAFTTTRQALFC
jgi:hypothetical protein